MFLEPIHLVGRVSLVSDESAQFERVNQLLGLELGAVQDGHDACTEGTLALDVPAWRRGAEPFRESLSQLVQVDLFGSHASLLTMRTAARQSPGSFMLGEPSSDA